MNAPPTLEKLSYASRSFRAALDQVPTEVWATSYIDNFPHGACGHVSELVGRYLSDQFSIEPEYVCGTLYDGEGNRLSSHAWLEWNGVTIDISADQFGWPPVIVSDCSTYHANIEIEERHGLNEDIAWWGQYCARIWNSAMGFLAHPIR